LQAQPDKENPISDMVMKILYAVEDEKIEIDENGVLTITPAVGAEHAE